MCVCASPICILVAQWLDHLTVKNTGYGFESRLIPVFVKLVSLDKRSLTIYHYMHQVSPTTSLKLVKTPNACYIIYVRYIYHLMYLFEIISFPRSANLQL